MESYSRAFPGRERDPGGGRGTGSRPGVPTWTKLILLIARAGVEGPGSSCVCPLAPSCPLAGPPGCTVQNAGWFLEAPGHVPGGGVFLRRPMAPPALPLTATGWQQRSPRQWLSPWPASWPVGRWAGLQGSGARGWVGRGRPWSPSVAAMVSPIRLNHFSAFRASEPLSPS